MFRDKLIEFLLPHVYREFIKLREGDSNVDRLIEQKGGLDPVVMHDTEALVDSMYKVTANEVYITSFCGTHANLFINENGLLSQWRGYGKDGGFAIVFNTQGLEEILQHEANKFDYSFGILADISYSNDEEKFKSELSPQMKDLAEYVGELFSHMKRGKAEGPDVTKAYPVFLQCISRYKHQGFKEENEVRIVAVPAIQDREYRQLAEKEGHALKPDKERKFRESKGERIPYIELFNSPEAKLPIERILVGPHKEKEVRASALRVMLRDTDIEVTVSDIPYVG
ncbi:MAG: DUF2971 domain-containing protein [Nitrososphaera sp.]|nr:DUF2971 domain-containing protein [Nitrososphaera sp.]